MDNFFGLINFDISNSLLMVSLVQTSPAWER
jgi:hypothetical protein